MPEVSTKVITPEFRASYVRVFEPAEQPNGDMAYSVQMIFPKNTDLSEMRAAAEAAMTKQFGEKSKWPKNYWNPFRDGDKDRDAPEYENSIFILAKTKNQPGVVDENVQPIMSADEFYSGCYARASVVFYAFDKGGNRGLGVGLNNLMKTRDGDRLDGKRSAEEDFASFAGSKPADSGFGDSKEEAPF